MDIVELKYQRFKAFLLPHVRNSAHQMTLNAASLELFLQSLNQYDGKSPQEITTKICDSFDVNLFEYSKDDINRFHRYLEYFQRVKHVL